MYDMQRGILDVIKAFRTCSSENNAYKKEVPLEAVDVCRLLDFEF